ncbi:MAG TPA: MFS transporter [Chryseosolibacter sp.]
MFQQNFFRLTASHPIFTPENVDMADRSKHRLFLSVFYFLSGFAFASWASRIPTIKANFGFTDAELGTILLFMPISSMIGLPLSGWMVSKYDSRVPLAAAFVMLGFATLLIGFSFTTPMLVFSICFFSFALRMLNISMNTQALTLQKMYTKRINGSFHGLWSTGGIFGVAVSTLLVALNVPMNYHLLMVSVAVFGVTAYSHRHLIRNDRAPAGNKFKLGKPDPMIVSLGLLLFFACICEGGMFDWSGIYFKEVVSVEIFTWGYLMFMVCMAISRFASDSVIERIGMQNTFVLSASFIIVGIGTAVIFPTFWPSLIGFCLVGFGTASIIPMVYLLAGTSKKYSPGIVISIIATYGIVGMLIGPPLIGYLSHVFSLRLAFIAFALSGLMLIPFSRAVFRQQA